MVSIPKNMIIFKIFSPIDHFGAILNYYSFMLFNNTPILFDRMFCNQLTYLSLSHSHIFSLFLSISLSFSPRNSFMDILYICKVIFLPQSFNINACIYEYNYSLYMSLPIIKNYN